MKLTVNGEAHEVPDGVTVQALLRHLTLEEGPVAVEVNQTIVPRADHPARKLAAGDVIEIVHLVGGG
jgi:sulfur carrier protein